MENQRNGSQGGLQSSGGLTVTDGMSDTASSAEIAQRQEDEYAFPYHYIPAYDDSAFSQTRHYSWGFRYLGGLKVVADTLNALPHESVLDVGCGEGRFLRDYSQTRPHLRLKGIDTSERSIAYARAFSPMLDFEVRDIVSEPPEERFDVATLIEVLEHIPPDQTDDFLAAIAKSLAPEGRLVLTVPHKNVPLIPKHFQHFDSVSLPQTLANSFEVEKLVFFDAPKAFPLWLMKTLLGGGGSRFVITLPALNRAFMRIYTRRYLYVNAEARCGRLLAIARPRA